VVVRALCALAVTVIAVGACAAVPEVEYVAADAGHAESAPEGGGDDAGDDGGGDDGGDAGDGSQTCTGSTCCGGVMCPAGLICCKPGTPEQFCTKHSNC
jgi:hypothetical protein